MVAGKAAGQPVLDQPRRAIGALEPVPALAAQSQRRIAPAVEEQQRLLAPFQPLLHRLDQRGGEPAAARRAFLAQIEDADIGQDRAAETGGQVDLFVNARLGHLQAFQRGGRAGEDGGDLLEPGAHHRDVARVVAHPVVLLEADLMRLVHDDQAKVAERQEQRGPCAHHDARAAFRHLPPRAAAVGLLLRAVPDGGGHAKARLEPFEEVLRQRDFGQQHQHLPPQPQRLGHAFEIGLGLARSGHAVEQHGREFARLYRIDEAVGGFLLAVRQVGRRVIGAGRGRRGGRSRPRPLRGSPHSPARAAPLRTRPPDPRVRAPCPARPPAPTAPRRAAASCAAACAPVSRYSVIVPPPRSAALDDSAMRATLAIEAM